MRPNANFYKEGYSDIGDHWTHFGELNENNKAHGRGIRFYKYGGITIGYGEDGRWSTDYYIDIYQHGLFEVGEWYMKDGKKRIRYTRFYPDGTEEEYDF
jgi:hypothetical protein